MEFTSGTRLLLSPNVSHAKILSRGDASIGESRLRGDISLIAHTTDRGKACFSIEHLGLITEGISLDEGETGILSILEIAHQVGNSTENADGSTTINIPVRASVLYRAIENNLPLTKVNDRYIPQYELFYGSLTGIIEEHQDGINFAFSSGALLLSYQEGGLGWLKKLRVPLDRRKVIKLKNTGDQSSFSLRVQPIGFKESSSDPLPTGKEWKTQLQKARTLWQKCGIDLEFQEITYIVSSKRKISLDPIIIRGDIDPEPFTLEVYFAASELADGGGDALSCGSALAAIVVSDKSTSNQNLVAHEVGHILCGIHPTDDLTLGTWRGDTDSVLEPMGGPTNPKAISENNCTYAKTAALTVKS